MTKLKILIGNSLDESSKRLTNFTKFLKEVTLTENGEYKYQDVTLQNYQASLNALWDNYKEFISKINESVERRFSELRNSPIFANLPIILDCKNWPQDKWTINEFSRWWDWNFEDPFNSIAWRKKNCEIGSIIFEWDCLKVEINSFLKEEKIT